VARILVVDDEQNTVHVLALILEQEGYEVLKATDGLQAMEAITHHAPDLVLTDVLMPVMDGYALYKKLKESPETAHLPVVVMSAHGAMVDTFEAVGVDRFLEKPVDKQLLLTTIEALLRSARPYCPRRVQRILVAGTYPEILDHMAECAQHLGCEVIRAATAADVLRKSLDFKESILVIDVQMEQGVSSADVIRSVRLLPEFREIPILVYTYFRVADLGATDVRQRLLHMEQMKKACMAAGATQYLDRYHPVVFKTALESVLTRLR